MRFNQYLNEGRSKQLSELDAVALLKKNCKQAIKSHKRGMGIYRGMDDELGYAFIDPKKHYRPSAHTDNYYTLIVDNSKRWSKYPDRSKSIICSTDEYVANNYGFPYAIFPYDGATIGVCPEDDFWFSFDRSFSNNLDSFNSELEYMMHKLNVSFDDKSYKNLVQSFKVFDMLVKDKPEYLDRFDDINWMVDYNGNLLSTVDMLFDPKNSKFTTVKIGSSLPMEKEVWTDSKCILIDTEVIDEVFKRHEL